MEIPDDAIPHFDVAGKLYAYEINDILYMHQVCIIGEAGAADDSRGCLRAQKELLRDVGRLLKNVRQGTHAFVAEGLLWKGRPL